MTKLSRTARRRTRASRKDGNHAATCRSTAGRCCNCTRTGPSKPIRAISRRPASSGAELALDWLPPKAIGNYSFAAGNTVVFNKLDKLFDVAIMMDCSQCPLHPQLKGVFNDYAKKNADIVRRHGAQPVFFMSWAYQDVPAMTAQLAAEYTRVGKEHNALVIPAGLAFARSIAQKPELNLYVADKRHPSLPATYLAACVTYASLFRKSPVGLSYTAGLDTATARHLQTVAWETVQDYFKS